jgi:hypothetical protein
METLEHALPNRVEGHPQERTDQRRPVRRGRRRIGKTI